VHPNAELITRFYEAFANCDGDAMAACYTDDATFSDPVFPGLTGNEPGGMWRMLTSQAKDLKIEFSDVVADDQGGSAHWEAWYTFSATGRKVHNKIDATFVFRDGKIAEHVDRFDLWAWTRMALGPVGVFLGWTPMVQNKIRGQAKAGLDKFLAGS
jgi:ketosteroid isomerase-like protein